MVANIGTPRRLFYFGMLTDMLRVDLPVLEDSLHAFGTALQVKLKNWVTSLDDLYDALIIELWNGRIQLVG